MLINAIGNPQLRLTQKFCFSLCYLPVSRWRKTASTIISTDTGIWQILQKCLLLQICNSRQKEPPCIHRLYIQHSSLYCLVTISRWCVGVCPQWTETSTFVCESYKQCISEHQLHRGWERRRAVTFPKCNESQVIGCHIWSRVIQKTWTLGQTHVWIPSPA